MFYVYRSGFQCAGFAGLGLAVRLMAVGPKPQTLCTHEPSSRFWGVGFRALGFRFSGLRVWGWGLGPSGRALLGLWSFILREDHETALAVLDPFTRLVFGAPY